MAQSLICTSSVGMSCRIMITIKTDIKETAANPKSGALGASKGSNSTASSVSTKQKQKQDNKGNEGAQSNALQLLDLLL